MLNDQQFDSLIERMKDKMMSAPKKTAIQLQAISGNDPGPLSSKFGGIPYLPTGMTYPCNTDTGAPLKLLAQLNFAELPHLEDFPERGILQFYIDPLSYDGGRDRFGANWKVTDLEQVAYRVLYHETSGAPHIGSPMLNDLATGGDFPFDGIFSLSASVVEQAYGSKDYQYENWVWEAGRELGFEETMRGMTHDDLFMTVDDGLDSSDPIPTSHQIGGYPIFTQDDPRLHPELSDYSYLLFQMDTQMHKQGWDIIWGDNGVGRFFITPQQLKDRDFSKVLYNWDCY